MTKHSDKAFMNIEAKISGLKGYIDCEILIPNSKVDLLIESLKETISKTEKRESNSSGKYSFSTEGVFSKKQFNKIPNGNSDSCVRGYN